MWRLYHSFLLVQQGLHLRLLSLPTRGLVLHGRLIMYCSAVRFQYSYLISVRCCSCHGNRWVGLAQLTCRSKKSSIGKISALKTMWYGPEDTKAPPKNVVVSLQKRQNQHCFQPVVRTLSTVASWFTSHTVADFITNKTLLPVGTTRDWREQPKYYKSWHETLPTEVNVHALGTNSRMAIIKKLTCGWKLACAIAWETMIFIKVA